MKKIHTCGTTNCKHAWLLQSHSKHTLTQADEQTQPLENILIHTHVLPHKHTLRVVADSQSEGGLILVHMYRISCCSFPAQWEQR